MSEVIRNVPFVLRPDLLVHLKDFNAKSAVMGGMGTNHLNPQVDFSEFTYDFDFERRVILEIDRQNDMQMQMQMSGTGAWNNGF
jgi:hypothetical protein